MLKCFSVMTLDRNNFSAEQIRVFVDHLPKLKTVKMLENEIPSFSVLPNRIINFTQDLSVDGFIIWWAATDQIYQRRLTASFSGLFQDPNKFTVVPLSIDTTTFPLFTSSTMTIEITDSLFKPDLKKLLQPSLAQEIQIRHQKWQQALYLKERLEFAQDHRGSTAEFPNFEKWRQFRGLPQPSSTLKRPS